MSRLAAESSFLQLKGGGESSIFFIFFSTLLFFKLTNERPLRSRYAPFFWRIKGNFLYPQGVSEPRVEEDSLLDSQLILRRRERNYDINRG